MTQANYKSTRLLVEAINREMADVRKAAMGNMALGSLNELRDLVGELIKKAERTALDDVADLAPAEYVATMKPVVARYHQQLMQRDLLAPCLCMDLRANACVMILIGDTGTVVRTAVNPDKPDAGLAVEGLLAAFDEHTKRIAAEVAAVTPEQAASAFEGIERQVADNPLDRLKTTPLTVEALEEGARVTIERSEGFPLCSGCDCVAGECDCDGCEGRTQ